jgi:hypothetical protein
MNEIEHAENREKRASAPENGIATPESVPKIGIQMRLIEELGSALAACLAKVMVSKKPDRAAITPE